MEDPTAKVRDREDALASTRDARAPHENAPMALKQTRGLRIPVQVRRKRTQRINRRL